jgi:beta-lactamase regulating signal transducer with metallopeptidase domain
MFEVKIGYGRLFNPTPYITSVSLFVLQVWGMGIFLGVGFLCYDLYRLKKRYSEVFDCPLWVRACFEEVMMELGIDSGKVQICRSYVAQIPCLVGIREPRIILPVEDYPKEALRMILLHELTHYKQRDVVLKRITFCVLILHFLNPMAWLLFWQVQKQSEYVCDYRAGRSAGNISFYFTSLMLVASEDGWFSVLSSQLFERKHELVERVRKMDKVIKVKKRSKKSVFVLMLVVLLASNMSVYAASAAGVDAYLEWYEKTDEETATTQKQPQYEEVIGYEETVGVVTVVGELEQITRGGALFDWTGNNNVKMCTSYFSCEAGEQVIVSAKVKPTALNVKVGVEREDGMKICVYGNNAISHTFTLPYGGYWRVYVQNESGQTVTVNGSYVK